MKQIKPYTLALALFFSMPPIAVANPVIVDSATQPNRPPALITRSVTISHAGANQQGRLSAVEVHLSGPPAVTVCVAFASYQAHVRGWGSGRMGVEDRSKCVQLDRAGMASISTDVTPTGPDAVVIANVVLFGQLLDTRAVPFEFKR